MILSTMYDVYSSFGVLLVRISLMTVFIFIREPRDTAEVRSPSDDEV